MTVVFEHVNYSVVLPSHMGGGTRVLLHNISGCALPGRMLALMGASGAGKTTLLDVLASRKNSGKMEGSVVLNGHPKEEDSFSRVTSYVGMSVVYE
jgi:ABC-type multidrug transport system ATPase subunit